jgi:hypothetical protein
MLGFWCLMISETFAFVNTVLTTFDIASFALYQLPRNVAIATLLRMLFFYCFLLLLCSILHNSFIFIFMLINHLFFCIHELTLFCNWNFSYSFLCSFYLIIFNTTWLLPWSLLNLACECNYFICFHYLCQGYDFFQEELALDSIWSLWVCWYLGIFELRFSSHPFPEHTNSGSKKFKSWCYLASGYEFLDDTSCLFSKTENIIF